MEIEELTWWSFKAELFQGCSIVCPECKKSSVHTEWNESSVYCELCGDHSAIECPKCNERFDHVWSPEFEVI